MATQTIEVSFLRNYDITLDLRSLDGLSLLKDDVVCTQVGNNLPVSRYRGVIVSNLEGKYLVQLFSRGQLLAADTVRLKNMTGIYLIDSLTQAAYPDPKYVLSGIDNGNGEPGELVVDTCVTLPDPPEDEEETLYADLSVHQKVWILDGNGKNTNKLGDILSTTSEDVYLVRTSSNQLIEYHASRLVKAN